MKTQISKNFEGPFKLLWQPFVIVLLAGFLVLGKWQTSVAFAATLSVNSTVDTMDINPGDGVCADSSDHCSLRAAIMETNALVGEDSISIPAGTYVLSIPGIGENASAQGDLDITDDLTIQGSGALVTIIDGRDLDRVFHLPTESIVNISGLTVQEGNPGQDGASGGGIFNGLEDHLGGILNLTDSIVINNTATYGGGIMNGWGASANLNGVTVSGNSAGYGGGIYTRDSGPFALMNSTVSNNTASGGGGGIDTWYYASLSLVNVSVIGNSAPFGGGIIQEWSDDLVVLTASIIANNNSGQDCGLYGVITSNGYNLDSDGTCNLGQLTDLSNVDPLVGPLQDNGGSTLTHALLTGSPASDHIPKEDCAVIIDQRNVARPQGLGCDIGAYEHNAWLSFYLPITQNQP